LEGQEDFDAYCGQVFGQQEGPTKVASSTGIRSGFRTNRTAWFMAIRPDWYFSTNPDYRISPISDKLLKYIKGEELNQDVEQHFRFLCSWLRMLEADDLLSFQHASNVRSPLVSSARSTRTGS